MRQRGAVDTLGYQANSQSDKDRTQRPPPPPFKLLYLLLLLLQDVIADCITIGDAVGLPDEGRAAAAGLTRRMEAAVQRVKELASEPKLSALGKTVAFLEWTDPL